jgi:hypothetical protein
MDSEAETCPTYSPSTRAFAHAESGVLFGRPPDLGGLAVSRDQAAEMTLHDIDKLIKGNPTL